MSLAAGTKLGPYEIISPLGAGGMGEVYRARDTKLQRDVALKILPDSMAHDAQRMARFEREAQVLASLNHPNIAAIYGLEESNGIRALVMELVEGETLAERLRRVQPLIRPASRDTLSPQAERGEKSSDLQPSPMGRGWSRRAGPGEGPHGSALQIEYTLPIARQIAAALEYAHERGVIHRDLKPANVKITPEGTVKVLDFGLAKAVAPSFSPAQSDADLKVGATDSPTLSALATQAGMILGTAAYMSPEQAKGQPVDRRCDIWAFGCVLYEMLAGRKAFEGETISDVLAAVIRAEPEWNAIPETTPPAIHRLVRRCLRKDQRQRLQAIGEARIAIEETLSGSPLLTSPLPQGEGGPAERDRVRVSPLRRALPWAVAAILVCIAAIAGWWIGTRGAAPSPNWSGDLLPGPTIAFFPRVSPDGHLIAFQAMLDNVTQVAVMDPGSGNWTVLTHDRTAGLVSNLCWSPDGSRIYFDRFISQPVGVYSVPALGGEERLVLDGAANPEALPDGSLLVVRIDPDRRSQIYHFGPDTGRLEALGAWVILNPSAPVRIFPGGKEAVFFGTVKGAESGNSPHLYLLDIATGSARRLAPELPIVQSSQLFPLAVTPDGKSVLIDLPSGSLHRIIAIPRSGTSPVRTLIMLTSMPWSLDVASDGNLYVDQVERPLEILRLPLSGGTPEVLESVESYTQYNAAPVEFPDERLLLPTLISGRPRLLLGKPGGSFVPLLETNEDSAPPMAQAGDDEVALMAGTPPGRMLTIASMKEGRIIHRFEATEGKRIDAVAASPDGKSLYYVSSGTVWSVPSQGGNPRKICAGDGIAVDPSGGDLIVNLNEQHHVRLERVPLSGGPVQSLQVRSDLPISPIPLGPNSLDKNGRLLVSVAPKDSWFFRLAILNLATGKLAQVPLNYTGDIMTPGWARDGRVLTTADPIRARIWRFRPVH